MINVDLKKTELEQTAQILAEDLQSIDRQIVARSFHDKHLADSETSNYRDWITGTLRAAKTKLAQLRSVERVLGDMRSGIETSASRYILHKKSVLNVVEAAIKLSEADDNVELSDDDMDKAMDTLKEACATLRRHFPEVANLESQPKE